MKRNEHNKSVGSSIERTDDRINATSEVFTPIEICKKMVSEIPEEYLKDPKSTFLDNAAGNGNFIVSLRDKLKEYHSEEHILNKMLYAVELMEDNHQEMCERLGVPTDHKHYVHANALKYHYEFGEPAGVENFYTN